MTKAPIERPTERERLRYDLWLLGLFSFAWIGVFLVYAGWLPLEGTLTVDLYRLYSMAAVMGWVAGNVYMLRKATLEKTSSQETPAQRTPLRKIVLRSASRQAGRFRKRLLLIYWLGPMSFVLLLRALASEEVQASAPFVPLYAVCVFCLFFLVPVTLKATRTPRLH